MTTQTNPNRVVTIAVSVMSILLLLVLLLLLLVILWRSKPPSINERNVCLRQNAAITYLDEQTRFNTHELSSSSDKTDIKMQQHNDLIDKHLVHPTIEPNASLDISNNRTNSTFVDINEDKSRRYEEETNNVWGVWRDEILTDTKGDLQYIRPLKLSHNLYEDSVSTKASRHHSGHFRHGKTQIWDPHPQYEFEAFGRKFHLQLTHDSDFISTNFNIAHVRSNEAKVKSLDHHLDCLYTGVVDGDPESIISVSLCHGMTGHLKTSTGNYLIKPTEQWSNNKSSPVGSPLEHAILRIRNNSTKSTNVNYRPTAVPNNKYECGVLDNMHNIDDLYAVHSVNDSFDKAFYGGINKPQRRKRRHLKRSRDYSLPNSVDTFFEPKNNNRYEESDELDDDDDESSDIWRLRRALPLREYFIEIMVVADAKMMEYHGNDLFGYILVLMSTVSRIYKDRSIGNPVSIALVKVITTDETFGTQYSSIEGTSASEMLRRFCHWQKRNNPSEPSYEHHDIALLLTRENLCHNPQQKLCDTLGLAELGRMCSAGSSCAIVQDNGLAAAFTIAHEIGHVLNMPHDDDSKCNAYRNSTGVHHIMSRMLDDNTFPWEWSTCSKHYITEFLESGMANCLLDQPGTTTISSIYSRLPGEDYTENKQCELVFGPGSTLCPHIVSDACKKLWCTAPYWDRSEKCHTQHMPWADGTPCGIGKWCHRGECVSRRNLKPIHGQWSEWGRYSECSRTCGGGIKSKVRECNNPMPQNGGNYCVGERIKYRSCGTKDCPPGSMDFREEQCSKYNNNNFNIQNLDREVKWHAKHTRILPEDRCKLYCQVESNQYYMLRNKVIDGTTCGPDTFHMCVDGRCRPAGCDHVLNSTAELDTCGVCRGDNSSCQRVTGYYNTSEYGYQRVTKIPAGSSFIDIKQYGWAGSANDSNYLAIRIGETGKYIINGNFMVMHRKVIIQPGLTIEYSGPEPVVERLNSTRPIGVDLIVEVLSVGNVLPPQIVYEYTVPKDILYGFKWVLSDWTECDRFCQGTKFRRAQCRRTKNGDIVSNDYCRHLEKPQEESQSCNQYCLLQWHISSITECSSRCGIGTQKVKYNCVQVVHSNSVPRTVPQYMCLHLERGPEEQNCTGLCKDVNWKYSEWSACSVSCGGGTQVRSAACTSDSNSKIVSDDKCLSEEKFVTRTCNQDPCPKWEYTDWTKCSVTCGVGWREKSYRCQVDNRIVSMSECSGALPQVKEMCDAGPCEKWHADEWTSCSATCGDAIQRRIVVCKDVNDLPSNRCDLSSKPVETRNCSNAACPLSTTEMSTSHSSETPINESSRASSGIESNVITSFKHGFEWHVAGYGKCSKSCGNGTTNRIIKCISSSTKMIHPSQYCDESSRPETIVACNSHPCPKWNTGDWSQCSVKCGEGYQARQVRCRGWRGHVLRDSDCSIKLKPRQIRKCQRHSCGSAQFYKWHTSNWSDCSATCGQGVQFRNVTCHLTDIYGWTDPNPASECLLDNRPRIMQVCKIRDCNDIYYWTTGDWRKCSHQCGKHGKQTRRLFCHDSSGKKVPRYYCSKESRPKRKRKCNRRQCGPVTCLDLKHRFRASVDGEYNFLIGNRNISIYCHAMSGNDPKEYLTLPAGAEENYAEIYGKRLLNPQVCPYNGKRNDTCDCVSDQGTISGKTMFRRIRIDTVKLYIIANDYTFSWTVGANKIEYGKAGDCYSLQNCPQGSFSINLSGTYFKISPQVSWTTQKMKAYRSINRINDQQIYGKCGGYCGFCTPSTELKLEVI